VSEPAELGASAARVQAILAEAGGDHRVVRFAATTRTAEDAAAAIGTTVAQIAKSLIFRGKQSGSPVLVIASGVNRVDEAAVAALIGEPIGRADADFVRTHTGFAIGGVAPVGHLTPPVTVIDADLLGFAEIWAAAGTPNTVFRLAPGELVALTGGRVAAVAQRT
jgi:prolyl-tRNA editing enzyme YbaK/EbsC (Cys-tRNA(Pro) deacylase)